MPNLKVGDVFVIPLGQDKYAYGQYVFNDDYKAKNISEYTGHGCMVKIFNHITENIKPFSEVIDKKEMFPYIFTGLVGAIEKKRWKVIGHAPIQNFTYPKFRKTFGLTDGKKNDWKIWDGKAMTFLGELPKEYLGLEKLCVWGYETLEKRILRGTSGHENLT